MTPLHYEDVVQSERFKADKAKVDTLTQNLMHACQLNYPTARHCAVMAWVELRLKTDGGYVMPEKPEQMVSLNIGVGEHWKPSKLEPGLSQQGIPLADWDGK